MSRRLCIVQKDVQLLSHAEASSADLGPQNAPIGLPLNTVLNSWSNIAQEPGLSQLPSGDGKALKPPDPPMEEAQAPTMRQTGSAQRNDAHKAKRVTATPAPIALTLPTEEHRFQMQSDKVIRIAPQVQNSDAERHQDPLVGSSTRPSTTTDASNRIRVSSFTPMSNLGNSVLATAVSSNTPSVDTRTQALASLSPPDIHHQPTRNVTGSSTIDFATSAIQNPSPQIRPSSSYGNCPAVPTAPSSQNPKPPPNGAFASPRNRESASLPVSSETFTGLFSAASVNASPHVRIPQSGAGTTPIAVGAPSLAGLPMLNWDRNVAARPEIQQFAGSKDESLVSLIPHSLTKY